MARPCDLSATASSSYPAISWYDPDDAPVPHITHDPATGRAYPAPTSPEPDFVALATQLVDACAEATDGCFPLEPDGVCAHGHPTWLRCLGVV